MHGTRHKKHHVNFDPSCAKAHIWRGTTPAHINWRPRALLQALAVNPRELVTGEAIGALVDEDIIARGRGGGRRTLRPGRLRTYEARPEFFGRRLLRRGLLPPGRGLLPRGPRDKDTIE